MTARVTVTAIIAALAIGGCTPEERLELLDSFESSDLAAHPDPEVQAVDASVEEAEEERTDNERIADSLRNDDLTGVDEVIRRDFFDPKGHLFRYALLVARGDDTGANVSLSEAKFVTREGPAPYDERQFREARCRALGIALVVVPSPTTASERPGPMGDNRHANLTEERNALRC